MLLWMLLATLPTSCTFFNRTPDDRAQPLEKCAAMYYWRTTWNPTDGELQFLQKHQIGRLYLRLFDVVNTTGEDGSAQPTPEATIQFTQPFQQQQEVVPVVFVRDDCLRCDSLLGQRIAQRVAQMCETHDLQWNELQIDCDWRPSTQDAYFRFLQQTKAELGQKKLSATIRLHQLSLPTPPVDRGILMCYNTGSMADATCANAILEEKEVDKYSQQLGTYALPLGIAYPLFRWNRLFRNGQFECLLRQTDLSDTSYFTPTAPGRYAVRHALSTPTLDPTSFGIQLRIGDEIWQDDVPADLIDRLEAKLESIRPGVHQHTVLYSLNENDILRYSNNEIENAFSASR